MLETALDAEMAEHLGYDKHDPGGRGSGNSRNGTRAKTVLTEIGPVEIEVPRDTNSSFDPQIVKKRQRRLTGIDEIVLSLTAKGLTTGEVAAQLRRRLRRHGVQGHHLPDHKRRYFTLIPQGCAGAKAARRVGVSMSCGSLWFIDAGSVKFVETPISSRYLSQDDRIEIADALAAGEAVKDIADRIKKSYQTVYREIARNRKPDGRYQPWYATG